jgi:hypothetical protein
MKQSANRQSVQHTRKRQRQSDTEGLGLGVDFPPSEPVVQAVVGAYATSVIPGEEAGARAGELQRVKSRRPSPSKRSRRTGDGDTSSTFEEAGLKRGSSSPECEPVMDTKVKSITSDSDRRAKSPSKVLRSPNTDRRSISPTCTLESSSLLTTNHSVAQPRTDSGPNQPMAQHEGPSRTDDNTNSNQAGRLFNRKSDASLFVGTNGKDCHVFTESESESGSGKGTGSGYEMASKSGSGSGTGAATTTASGTGTATGSTTGTGSAKISPGVHTHRHTSTIEDNLAATPAEMCATLQPISSSVLAHSETADTCSKVTPVKAVKALTTRETGPNSEDSFLALDARIPDCEDSVDVRSSVELNEIRVVMACECVNSATHALQRYTAQLLSSVNIIVPVDFCVWTLNAELVHSQITTQSVVVDNDHDVASGHDQTYMSHPCDSDTNDFCADVCVLLSIIRQLHPPSAHRTVKETTRLVPAAGLQVLTCFNGWVKVLKKYELTKFTNQTLHLFGNTLFSGIRSLMSMT